MQKYLKLLRVFFSLLLMAGMAFLFLDFTSSVGTAWYRRLTYLSFVPSLDLFVQSLIHGLALTAWGWLAVLILTLLFGRVYCSFLCPLGVLQDIISFLSRKSTLRKRPFRFKYSKPLNWVRFPILIVTLVSLAVTGTLLVNLLDPYSHFGRIVADLFRPVYIYGNNLLAALLEKAGSYLLYPVDIIAGNPLTLIVPVIVLILLLSSGWCRALRFSGPPSTKRHVPNAASASRNARLSASTLKLRRLTIPAASDVSTASGYATREPCATGCHCPASRLTAASKAIRKTWRPCRRSPHRDSAPWPNQS